MLRSQFDPGNSYSYIRYGRMSDDKQNPRSPEQQFDTIHLTLRRLGLNWTHLCDYRDDGITGRLLRKRLGYQQMLQDIRTGMIAPDLILVDTVERFGRVEELDSIRRNLFNKHGVVILTADSNFTDPTSVSGKALTLVETIRATEDGRIKAHTVLRGKRDAARLKHWPGGPPPFGYQLDSVMVTKNGRQEVDHCLLVPAPKTAWIVKLLFEKAQESGFGTMRLAKFLNDRPDIPDEYKPFYPESVGYMLDNPIYYGELLWEEHSTGIVDDCRVIKRNQADEMLRVPEFCQPLIARETWDTVQTLRNLRRQQHTPARPGNDKQITAPAPGLALKYPLTGLVKCGHCGRCLRPSPTKAKLKSGKVWRRTYYMCPGQLSGACPNGRYFPEDWLREVVIGQVRYRLFPSPNRAGQVPDWFGPLVEQVRRDLELMKTNEPDQRAAWIEEQKRLNDQVLGWSQSLANPRLPPEVRADIEVQYGQAKARLRELQHASDSLDHRAEQVRDMLDPAVVLQRLHHLAQVLGGSNPTQANIELSRHIDRIDCFKEGKVVLHTSKLGVFEGAVKLLSRPVENGQVGQGNAFSVIRPRRRARLRADEQLAEEAPAVVADPHVATDPRRFAGLDGCWFWQDTFDMPVQRPPWSEEHAAEVARLRATMTMEQLAAHFGKTIPTIRKALQKAAAAGVPVSDLPKKMSRACWAKKHAAEIIGMKQQGKGTLEIAKHFGKSDTTIRAALKLAQS